MKPITWLATLVVGLAGVNPGRADHGPGTSGGGAATQSGETLKPGNFAVEFREEYTEFEDLSQSQIEAKSAKAGVARTTECWDSLTRVS